MGDWAQIAAAAIPATAAIICEIIRRRPPGRLGDGLPAADRGQPKPEVPATRTKRLTAGRRAKTKRATDWGRARNLALILFAAGLAADIALAYLPRPLPASRTRAVPIRIEITQYPPAGDGGSGRIEHIAGKVSGVKPEDFRVVIYAHVGSADHWYVQPYIAYPFTGIDSDGRWENSTHLGDRYAALLVKPSFQPPQVTDALPSIGGDDIVASTNMAPMP